jgi:hypothetical protein
VVASERIESATRGFSAISRWIEEFINQALTAIATRLLRHTKAQSWHAYSEVVTYMAQHFRTPIHINRAIRALREVGRPFEDAWLQHITPVHWNFINLTGNYCWRQSKRAENGSFRTDGCTRLDRLCFPYRLASANAEPAARTLPLVVA